MPDGLKGIELKERVAAKIAELNPNVAGQVIQHFVDMEIKKRTETLVRAIDKLNTLIAERKQLNRPDTIFHMGIGPDAQRVEQWTDARIKQAKKLDETIARLDNAIAKALGPEADYQQVEKAVKGGAPGAPGGQKVEGEEGEEQ